MSNTSAIEAKLPLAIHKCNFLDFKPAGIVSSSLHPNGNWLAVVRANGNLELWNTSTYNGQSFPEASKQGDKTSPSGASAWLLTTVIPGTARIPIQALCWVEMNMKDGYVIDGARLFATGLDGSVYEAIWISKTLRKVADSNGGAVWSISSYSLLKVGGMEDYGSIVAIGCEDGSVRLLHASPASSDLEHIVSCPGTDGRTQSLGWHPTLPVLFAGSAQGTVRGWDFTEVTQKILTAYEHLKINRAANIEAAKRRNEIRKAAARRMAQKRKTTQSSDSDSSSSSDSDDSDDEFESVDFGQLFNRGATVGPQPVIGFQVETGRIGANETPDDGVTVQATKSKRFQTIKAIIWSLAVASDFTVITADSLGNVTSFDGRMGVPSSSLPIIRHEGDVLSISITEHAAESTGNGSNHSEPSIADAIVSKTITIASAGMDGYVHVVSRPANTSKWITIASHAGHTHPVRTVAVHPWNRFVVSGSADTHMAVFDPVGQPEAPPSLISPISSSQFLVSSASDARVTATVSPHSLDIWSLRAPSSKTKNLKSMEVAAQVGNTTIEDMSHVLSIQLYSGTPESEESSLQVQSDQAPFQPSMVSISADGSWVVYTTSENHVPKLYYLHQRFSSSSSGPSVTEVTPTFIPFPDDALKAFKPGYQTVHPSHMTIDSITDPKYPHAPKCALLSIVYNKTIHVLLLSPPAKGNVPPRAKLSRSGRKRASRSEDPEELSAPQTTQTPPHLTSTPEVSYLYSLAIPHMGATVLSNATQAEDDEEDAESQAVVRPNAKDMSLITHLVSASHASLTEVHLAVCNNLGFITVYKCTKDAGVIVHTFSKLPSIPTALAFSPSASALFTAFRDVGIVAFSSKTGKIAPWSPTLKGDERLKAVQELPQVDPILQIVPITNADAESQLKHSSTASVKVLAFSSQKMYSLSINPTLKGDDDVKEVAFTSSSNEKYQNILFAASLNHSSDIPVPGRGNATSVAEIMLVSIPKRQMLSSLPPAIKRKKYGT